MKKTMHMFMTISFTLMIVLCIPIKSFAVCTNSVIYSMSGSKYCSTPTCHNAISSYFSDIVYRASCTNEDGTQYFDYDTERIYYGCCPNP
jgi:hypothetical protein